MMLKNWEETIGHFKDNINYNENKRNKILEVGCGAGALLKIFESDNEIYGIDPSIKYIEIIKKAIPNGNFINGDALQLKHYDNNYFDIIFCHSCIQYFKDLSYFNNFVKLCYEKLKPGGKLSLTDIQDKDMKEKYIIHRKNVIGKQKYKEKYENTNLYHFYLLKKRDYICIK